MLVKINWAASFLVHLGLLLFFAQFSEDQTFATHFDFSGNPDGFLPGPQYALIMGFVALFLNGLLLGLYFLSRTEGFIDYTKIPNKEYWVQSGRLKSKLQSFLCTMGSWLNILLFVTGLYIIRATENLPTQNLDGSYVYFMVAMMLILFVVLFRSFAKPKDTASG